MKTLETTTNFENFFSFSLTNFSNENTLRPLYFKREGETTWEGCRVCAEAKKSFHYLRSITWSISTIGKQKERKVRIEFIKYLYEK